MIFLVGFFWYLQALVPDSASAVTSDIYSLMNMQKINANSFQMNSNSSSKFESFFNQGKNNQTRNKVEDFEDNLDKILID
ncbi:MAG: hypothetical protein EPN82_01910 [Bacteroidetes bacterium]|nr:MAG: hypothetical protein EPN82_01910 [Bacteroidota bacterium]